MSLVCSVIFIHHAFNANILDKDYAFSDGEILMVDNAVRTHFEPYERHFKEILAAKRHVKIVDSTELDKTRKERKHDKKVIKKQYKHDKAQRKERMKNKEVKNDK